MASSHGKERAMSATMKKEAALPVSVWEMEVAAAAVLRDRNSTGINLDGGIEGYLSRGGYAPLPGNIGPYEVYEAPGDISATRFVVIAHYPSVILLILCYGRAEFEAFMKEYGTIGQTLHYRLLPEQKVVAPNNLVTSYTRASGRW